jgi:hypothetical protein
MQTRFLQQLVPMIGLAADEIGHFHPRAARAGEPSGQLCYGAHMLLELAGLGAVQRPVAGIMDARGDLVDHNALIGAFADHEQLDREHADIAERVAEAAGQWYGRWPRWTASHWPAP